MSAPWDIYAAQLLPLGYGYPLWLPEPDRDREILIGDVGWLEEGGFSALFNSMKDASDPVNAEHGVPVGFTVFGESLQLRIDDRKRINQDTLHGGSIHRTDVRGNAKIGQVAPVPLSAGAGFSFKWTIGSGAFVRLDLPAQSRRLLSKMHIKNYIRKNHQSWLEFANNRNGQGIGLKEEDIIFICGTVKTTRWAVVAFESDRSNERAVHVTGECSPYASGDLSVKFEDHVLSNVHHRHGPEQLLAIASDRRLEKLRQELKQELAQGLEQEQTAVTSEGLLQTTDRDAIDPVRPSSAPCEASTSPPPADQCLFVHYYKMKRRMFVKILQAAAGPHELPPGQDNPGMDAPTIAGADYEFETEQGTDIVQDYDPVNILLDYILSQSAEAEVAIASDLDLYAIFADREFPNASDMAAALEEVGPAIKVDEHGVGTISCDTCHASRQERDDSLLDGECMRRRSPSTGSFPCRDASSSHVSSPSRQLERSQIDEELRRSTHSDCWKGSFSGNADDNGGADVCEEKAAGERPAIAVRQSRTGFSEPWKLADNSPSIRQRMLIHSLLDCEEALPLSFVQLETFYIDRFVKSDLSNFVITRLDLCIEGKQQPLQEYVLAHVSVMGREGLQPCGSLRAERRMPPKTSLFGAMKALVSSSDKIPADDRVQVCDISARRQDPLLCSASRFIWGDTFTIDRFIAAGLVIGDYRPYYDLDKHQASWFAGMLYGLLAGLDASVMEPRPETKRFSLRIGQRDPVESSSLWRLVTSGQLSDDLYRLAPALSERLNTLESRLITVDVEGASGSGVPRSPPAPVLPSRSEALPTTNSHVQPLPPLSPFWPSNSDLKTFG